jgi:hypothetical protein
MHSRVAVLAGAIVAPVVTCVTGTPARLPDVALSSGALFHVERTVALLAGYIAFLVPVIRAWGGQLPSELSAQGIKYSEGASEAARAWDDAAQELETARGERADLLKRVEALERRGVR